MSDLFASKLADKRKELAALLADQAGRLKDIEEFSVLAKRMGVDTKDLEELLKVTKAMLKAAGVKPGG